MDASGKLELYFAHRRAYTSQGYSYTTASGLAMNAVEKHVNGVEIDWQIYFPPSANDKRLLSIRIDAAGATGL
jgi:hypothetical protein